MPAPALPLDMWGRVMDAQAPSDAARLACACRVAAAAHRASRYRAPRVAPASLHPDSGRIAGEVLEPASGDFNATVAPGESLAAAVRRCPRGGSVLLLPGTHGDPGDAFLRTNADVHVFGRGAASIALLNFSFVLEAGAPSFVDVEFLGPLRVAGGARVRLQQCTLRGDVTCADAGTDPTFDRCTFGLNVVVTSGSKAAFGRCAFEGLARVTDGASPAFVANSFRNGHGNISLIVEGASVAFASNDVQPGAGIAAAGMLTIGVLLRGQSTGCAIERNTIGACTIGLDMEGRSEARVSGNELWNNHMNVRMAAGSRATFEGNHLRAVGPACVGIAMFQRDTCATVVGNSFSWHVEDVIVFPSAEASVVTDNVFRDSCIGVHFHDAPSAPFGRMCSRNRFVDVDRPHIRSNRALLAESVLVGVATCWLGAWGWRGGSAFALLVLCAGVWARFALLLADDMRIRHGATLHISLIFAWARCWRLRLRRAAA